MDIQIGSNIIFTDFGGKQCIAVFSFSFQFVLFGVLPLIRSTLVNLIYYFTHMIHVIIIISYTLYMLLIQHNSEQQRFRPTYITQIKNFTLQNVCILVQILVPLLMSYFIFKADSKLHVCHITCRKAAPILWCWSSLVCRS